MKRKRVSPERRKFERATLKQLAEAGASPADLGRYRSLLVRGRKPATADYGEALNLASCERSGIEYALRSLRGDAPEFVIYRINPLPEVSRHG